MGTSSRPGAGGNETPLPHRKLTPLLLLVAAESFNGTALFAYVGTQGARDALDALLGVRTDANHKDTWC